MFYGNIHKGSKITVFCKYHIKNIHINLKQSGVHCDSFGVIHAPQPQNTVLKMGSFLLPCSQADEWQK